MGIRDLFRKNKGDIIDLADLQKRGIFKPRSPSKKDDVIDLSNSSSDSEGSALGFLGNLAGSSGSSTEEPNNRPSSVILDSTKKQRLKGILRDLKVDMKHAGDKVYKLSDRIDLLEKKLERIERRVGL